MITWALIVISIFLSLVHSWWWLIAVFLFSAFKAYKWYFYQSRPWRKIHYPAYRYYAAAAALESAEADDAGREFQVRNALIKLLEMVQPNWDKEKITLFVDTSISKCKSFVDKDLIHESFKKKYENITDADIDKFMSSINEERLLEDNSWIVRIAVAEMIEQQFSIEDRGEYLVESLLGNAK